MINKLRAGREDKENLPVEPFHLEVNFLEPEKDVKDIYNEIREVIKLECKKIDEHYQMEASYVMLVSFVVEILKNIRFH